MQSDPLRCVKLLELQYTVEPMAHDGLVNTKIVVVIFFSCWFIRDLEGCVAKIEDMAFNRQAKVVTWRLSASKTDPCALGCERQWGCLCPAAGCPYCAVCEHIAIPKDLFGEDAVASSFPSFLM